MLEEIAELDVDSASKIISASIEELMKRLSRTSSHGGATNLG